MNGFFMPCWRAGCWAACCAALLLARGAMAESAPFAGVQGARIDQNIGAAVEGGLAFVDEAGRSVRLGDLFGSKPSILVLAYYHCPELCPMSLRHLVQGLNAIGPGAGADYNVIVVSFDPGETPADAAGARALYVRGYRHPEDAALGRGGWYFLTGSQEAIGRLAATVGFHYRYDPASKRFAHAAGAVVLDPDGRISSCFFGIDYPPASLEGALHDAAARRGRRIDRPQQQYCGAYDPSARRRTRIVTRIIQGAGLFTILLLMGYIATHLGSKPPIAGGRP